MEKTLILSVIESGLRLEIINPFHVKENEIYIKLSNGSTAKITTKYVK